MIKIGMIGIAAVFLALLLKKEKGELALLVGIAGIGFDFRSIFLHIVTHATCSCSFSTAEENTK